MSGIHEASTFPNGKRKSDLYDFFLTHWDFACSQKKYELDIEFIRIEERQNLKNCRWHRDSDGQLVVSGLDLRDKGARVLITRDGFTVDLKAGKLVFISYAREDLRAATLIKDAIDRTGLVCWLDVHYLHGGVRWKAQIARIIQKADFFVAVLSKLSVEKRGFVQREIREALETALSIPDSRIFIVPVRLDQCEPTHPAFQELNWVDLFPDWDTGIRRLIQSLHAALSRK
jgi:hypothetical protein